MQLPVADIPAADGGGATGFLIVFKPKGGVHMTLGEIIQKKRSEQGLSQEQLAELVGVSRQAVSKWELGDAVPDTDKLVPLARALRISVDELLGNIPEQQDNREDGAAQHSDTKQPGWFATHWYWLGLIPVIWGGISMFYYLILVVFSLVFSFAA